jgi:hypothetical protein
MKIIHYILILLIILSAACFSQTQKCNYCKKAIVKEYIVVDGSFYHLDHFKCSECNKRIEDDYTKSEGKYYHSKCYFNEVLKKCDVCNKPLTGKFYTDIYNKTYHQHHTNEYQHCDNCNRFAAPRITNGGRKFDDGRFLCNHCNQNALVSISQYKNLLNRVKTRLKGLGIILGDFQTDIIPVDQKKLNSIGKSYGKGRLKGFCEIEVLTSNVGNSKDVQQNRYKIYVLNNLPSIYVETTIAHELMHIWLHENTLNNHDEALEEGSCHFISYLYLNTTRSEEAQWIIKLMKQDQNKIYGGGFRKVLEVFDGKSISQLLTFLKENKQL